MATRNISILVGREPRAFTHSVADQLTLADTNTRQLTAGSTGTLFFTAGDTSVAGQSWTQLDGRLAARVGVQTPLVAGYRSYSGSSFPSSFASSSAQAGYNYGCKAALLNVKTNWTSLANGGQDSKIQNWASTIPAGFTLYLICDHEPENDGRNGEAGTWRAGQARIANLIAEVNDDRLHYVVCHMAYTFESASGRNPEDWNPWPQMTTAAKARTVFGPDGYTRILNSSGTSYQTMDDKLGRAFAKGVEWGAQRFAISEHILNNDVDASGAACANIWTNHVWPWVRSKNLAYYALYNHKGPAAGGNGDNGPGNPFINTPEEETAVGQFALECRQ